MNPIYKPKGRAGEYCGLAINIYTGCNHGCTYCFAKKFHDRYKPSESFADVRPRKGLVEAAKKQLASGKYKGKTIQLCFTCDPYPADVDTTPTREIIKAIKGAGAKVQILTKGGRRADRDFDLLDSADSFGITFTGYEAHEYLVPSDREINAAPPAERLASLRQAHLKGIKTWVSCEPVFTEQSIYNLIRSKDYIDLFKIGKLNYYPSDINWGEFGRECEGLCKEYGRNYYIKEDLRKEMATI